MQRAAGFVVFSLVAAAAASGLEPPGDAELKMTVDDRVEAWKATPEEKRFDLIGWAPDLRTARRLAVEHRRPVFLFTMDGRVNHGRC